MIKYNSFTGMLSFRNKTLADETYKRFPKKVKKIIKNKHIMLCDSYYHSKFPNKRIGGMPLGFYHEGKGLIDIIPEESKNLSDKGVIGLIAHETAHSYIDKSFFLVKRILKSIFELKFNRLAPNMKRFYGQSEELYANWLAKKWGFKEEIDILNKERVFKNNKNE